MKQSISVRSIALACSVLVAIGLIVAIGSMMAGQPSSQENAAGNGTKNDGLQAVWQRAMASGAYQFSADVVQKTIPMADIANLGRTSREQTFHLTGDADLAAERLELTMQAGVGVLNHGKCDDHDQDRGRPGVYTPKRR